MIQIKRASELTGVSEATLRIWERRYGLGATHRSDSGYRLYSNDDITAIKEMHRLVEAGWPAQEAAKAAKAKDASSPSSLTSKSFSDELSEKFFSAINNLDSILLQNVLDEVFSKSSFEHVVDYWLAPTLEELGNRWHEGKLNIASEHFASHAIMRRLSAAYESAGQSKKGPRLVIGAPSGSAHEIGTLAFATVIRRLGYPVIYLGVEVPTQSWVDAVKQYKADAVVISVKRSEDVNEVQDCISKLRVDCPETKIIVGSNFANQVKGADLVLAGNLSKSSNLLSEFFG